MRPGPRPKLDRELLTLLREAIIDCRIVELRYLSQSTGRRSRQNIELYGMVGRTDWNGGMRLWRLANMSDARVSMSDIKRYIKFVADGISQSSPMKLSIAALRRYLMSIGMFLIPFFCFRIGLLRLCGVKIGKGCYIGFNVICDTNFSELVEIGNQVTVSHNTLIFAHTVTPVKSYLSGIYNQIKEVKIKDGAWIGANCIILPGVSIGENSMVGAGSVVSQDTTPYCLYAGNPCRKIKDLSRQSFTKQIQ